MEQSESSVTSATFTNVTCREVFWVLPPHCPGSLPVAPNYTIIFSIHLQEKKHRTPISNTEKKEKNPLSFLVFCIYNDGKTSAK